jgi:hypothetical protein
MSDTVQISALPASYFDGDGGANNLEDPAVIAAVDALTEDMFALETQIEARKMLSQSPPLLLSVPLVHSHPCCFTFLSLPFSLVFSASLLFLSYRYIFSSKLCFFE